ncbi:MAG: glycosyltransferase family 2 protein [archaeon]|jgi:cellulose synthase/poly-beta-1,6-N-acetylglucosamine synthase-like glycosyltransferase
MAEIDLNYKVKVKFVNRIIILIVFIIIFAMIQFISGVRNNFYFTFVLFLIFILAAILTILSNLFNPVTKSSEENLPMPKKVPTVAVVTYAFNNFKGIERTVKRLSELEYPISYNVYIINDGTMGYLKKYKNVKLLTLDKKYFTKGQNIKAIIMNIAFKKLKEENIFCLDGDSLPDKDVLMKMTPLLRKNVAAVFGVIKPENTNNLIEKMQFFEYSINLGFGARGLSKMNSVFALCGALNLMNREKFIEVGGFDIYNITEDGDLAYAFQQKGYTIRHTIFAKAVTEVPSTIKGLIRQRIRWYRGTHYTWLKYKSMIFNNSSGFFGMFIMPYYILLNILSIGLFFRFVFINLYRFYVQTYFLVFESIKSGVWIFQYNLNSITLITPIAIIGLFGFGITLLLLILAFSTADVKIERKDILPFLLFFWYCFIITIIFVYSLVMEFIGTEYKW